MVFNIPVKFEERKMKPSSENYLISSVLAICCATLCSLLVPHSLLAHPISQGAMEIVVGRCSVLLRARVSVDEVCLSNCNWLFVNDQDMYDQKELADAFTKHGLYLLSHLHLSADGCLLAGKILKMTPPEIPAEGMDPRDTLTEFIVYELEYSGKDFPKSLKCELDELKNVDWQTSYVIRIRQEDQPEYSASLLSCGQSLVFPCTWNSKLSGIETFPVANTRVDTWKTTREYLLHGIQHIVGYPGKSGWEGVGYDHLLFISALTLAAMCFGDLIKIITAFTLAHTLTLTLAALRIFTLSERIVEPMIAASIVFVAVENMVWPIRSRGWGRLAIAFGFGLFHGLGFAGGLIEAMQDMPRSGTGIAIGSFSIGVELGHQMIVLPLFAALLLGRRWMREDDAKERFRAAALKYGSAVISVAGLFFLARALKIG